MVVKIGIIRNHPSIHFVVLRLLLTLRLPTLLTKIPLVVVFGVNTKHAEVNYLIQSLLTDLNRNMCIPFDECVIIRLIFKYRLSLRVPSTLQRLKLQ